MLTYLCHQQMQSVFLLYFHHGHDWHYLITSVTSYFWNISNNYFATRYCRIVFPCWKAFIHLLVISLILVICSSTIIFSQAQFQEDCIRCFIHLLNQPKNSISIYIDWELYGVLLSPFSVVHWIVSVYLCIKSAFCRSGHGLLTFNSI